MNDLLLKGLLWFILLLVILGVWWFSTHRVTLPKLKRKEEPDHGAANHEPAHPPANDAHSPDHHEGHEEHPPHAHHASGMGCGTALLLLVVVILGLVVFFNVYKPNTGLGGGRGGAEAAEASETEPGEREGEDEPERTPITAPVDPAFSEEILIPDGYSLRWCVPGPNGNGCLGEVGFRRQCRSRATGLWNNWDDTICRNADAGRVQSTGTEPLRMSYRLVYTG